MRSGTLSSKGWFSPALFRKNAARFWPLWVFYGGVQFFLLDMDILMAGERLGTRTAVSEYMQRGVYGGITWAAIPGAAFGCFFAMALFSYLMNNRSAGMLHALPIRREGLFATNYASGLCFFLVPDIVAAVIAMAGAAAWGVNLVPEVLWWLFIQVLVGMFFFSFAVCCAMFTGHILALPVFYGILNFLVAGVTLLADEALGVLLTGYGANSLSSETFTRWCTPVWNLTYQLLYYRPEYEEVSEVRYFAGQNPAAAVGYCIVLLAVFTSIAVGVYRLRELERAGDVVTVAWVRPVFQFGLGFCTGLLGGVALYLRFFNQKPSWVFILLAAVCAMIGAFAGRMLLKKTLRVFADGWRGPAVLGVCMVALLVGARMDLFGYQRWTPDPAKVESAEIWSVRTSPDDTGRYGDIVFRDPEDVAALVEFHQALTADLAPLRQARENGLGLWSGYNDGNGYAAMGVEHIQLAYTMTDGSRVRREYSTVPVSAEALKDPDTYAARLEALINRPEAVEQSYINIDRWGDGTARPDSLDELEAVAGWLDNVREEPQENGGEDIVPGTEMYSDDKYARPIGNYTIQAGYTKLWEAVRADLKAGNIGRRYLLDSKERYDNCYQTDLGLTLLYSWTDREGQRQSDSRQVSFTIQKSATETMKALEEMGLTELLVPWEIEK